MDLGGICGVKEMDVVIEWGNTCLAEWTVMLFTQARKSRKKGGSKRSDGKINFGKALEVWLLIIVLNGALYKSSKCFLFL